MASSRPLTWRARGSVSSCSKRTITSAAPRPRKRSSLTTTPGSRATLTLVALFPEKIIRDLGLDLELRRRTVASFTPYVKEGRHGALLLSNISQEISRQSIIELTGSDAEFDRMKQFYSMVRLFAENVWDTMLSPLQAKEDFRRRFDESDGGREAWRSLVEEPLGCALERYLQDDVVRGLAFTDAKIGVFTHAHDETLLQNRCFPLSSDRQQDRRVESPSRRDG